MTRKNQKSWEEFHLTLFNQLRPDLMPAIPILADPPAPDSVLVLPDRTIGIELTTFLWDAIGPAGSSSRALHSLRRRVVERARQLWEVRKLPPVDVSLLWQNHENLSKEDIEPLAVSLVNLVTRRLPEVDGHLTLAYPAPGWKELPSHAAAVFVSRPAWLSRPVWEFSQGGSVPHLRDTSGHLQRLLEAKESRVPGYRERCDEVWLLIVADMVTTQSFVVIDDDPALPMPNLVSSFDRAFFLSVAYQRVVELSLLRPK